MDNALQNAIIDILKNKLEIFFIVKNAILSAKYVQAKMYVLNAMKIIFCKMINV